MFIKGNLPVNPVLYWHTNECLQRKYLSVETAGELKKSRQFPEMVLLNFVTKRKQLLRVKRCHIYNIPVSCNIC